jgi:hypothetical protein
LPISGANDRNAFR